MILYNFLFPKFVHQENWGQVVGSSGSTVSDCIEDAIDIKQWADQ